MTDGGQMHLDGRGGQRPAAARDLEREHTFLTETARGDAALVEHVEQRLADGEERFGSSWSWIGIRRHLVELGEEAADLAAWAVLADQALDHESGLSDLHVEQLRGVLAVAAQHGARAHSLLVQAQASVERAR